MHFIRKLRLLKVEGRDWGLPWHMGGPIAPSLFSFAHGCMRLETGQLDNLRYHSIILK